jgi:ketosteroid isomerase-like protein
MAQNPQELLNVARAWLKCFETRDLEALVSLYAEDARHTSPKLRVQRPETGGFLIGRAALRDWWASAFQRIPQLRYQERSLTADGERVFMEYVRIAPGEPDLPVAEVLDVRDGKIVASRVYHG